MIFPEFIKPGDIIGVTAPSGGVEKEGDIIAFKDGATKLEKLGYKVIFTDSVFKSDGKGRSTDAKTRAKEFMELIRNKEVKYICSAKGGDYLMEMLPYLDFEEIKKNPKWFQGYSDNTFLTYNILTKCDIATIYCNNFGDYGMKNWHEAVENNLKILEGKINSQHNFEYYEDGFYKSDEGKEPYHEDKKVEISACINEKSIEKACFSGRLIGGCMDVVIDNIGNGYENTHDFIEKYNDEGIVWYLESFLSTTDSVIRNLWKMNELGFFKNTKGIIFGRELMYTDTYGMAFKEAAMEFLKDKNIPVVFGADIGHKAPQMCMVNGAIAKILYENGKLEMNYSF